jgi:glutathione peroxidase-family protein
VRASRRARWRRTCACSDQRGQEVSLWQFHGNVVLLDISTMWCAPCQDLALGTEETYHQFADRGFVYLTVLQEDVESQPPEVDDLSAWAAEFGITSPVLADGEKFTGEAVQQGLYPAVLLIGRDLRVIERVLPADDPSVRAAISDAL